MFANMNETGSSGDRARDGAAVTVVDSVTDLGRDAAGRIVVAGSHGGAASGAFARGRGVAAAVFNDAGVGLNGAGIGALFELEVAGIPAATVAHTSARIGDGTDALRSGIVSHSNRSARELGIVHGARCDEAVTLLHQTVPRAAPKGPIAEEFRRLRTTVGASEVIVLDSASQIDETMIGCVALTGSHGGLVGNNPARALKHPMRFVAFNDAGVGKDDAGVLRLDALEAQGVPAVTVSYETAEIGNGRSTLETGVISHVNGHAAEDGATIGLRLRDVVERLHPTRN